MDPSETQRMLLVQHEGLRVHLARCSSLASLFRSDQPVMDELDSALAELRIAFAEHNTLEKSAISTLLDKASTWSATLIDRMLEEHVAEHAVFWELLAGAVSDVVARMDDLVDELDAHMAAEERTFYTLACCTPTRSPDTASNDSAGMRRAGAGGMAAIFALIFVPAMAAVLFMLGTLHGTLSPATAAATAAFTVLIVGLIVGLVRMMSRWEAAD